MPSSESAPGAADRASRSLAQLIADGDRDALAGFHDRTVRKVQSYCAAVCRPDAVDAATEASFVDFEGRVRATKGAADSLEELLLRATRAAAASRLELTRPQDVRRRSGAPEDATCMAVAAVLAAERNGELLRPADPLYRHLAQCGTCKQTLARIQEAERTFVEAVGWDLS